MVEERGPQSPRGNKHGCHLHISVGMIIAQFYIFKPSCRILIPFLLVLNWHTFEKVFKILLLLNKEIVKKTLLPCEMSMSVL